MPEVGVQAERERESTGRPREQLEQRHAGVVLVPVGPVGHLLETLQGSAPLLPLLDLAGQSAEADVEVASLPVPHDRHRLRLAGVVVAEGGVEILDRLDRLALERDDDVSTDGPRHELLAGRKTYPDLLRVGDDVVVGDDAAPGRPR